MRDFLNILEFSFQNILKIDICLPLCKRLINHSFGTVIVERLMNHYQYHWDMSIRFRFVSEYWSNEYYMHSNIWCSVKYFILYEKIHLKRFNINTNLIITLNNINKQVIQLEIEYLYRNLNNYQYRETILKYILKKCFLGTTYIVISVSG